MLYCFTSRVQIVLCSLVVYLALALYFTPPHPLPPFNKAGLLALATFGSYGVCSATELLIHYRRWIKSTSKK